MATEFFKSKQSMFGLSSDNLLGELLVKSGVVDPKRLKEITCLPANRRMQLGQMLLVGGYVTQGTLDVALKAEAYVKDKVIDTNTAIKLIKTALKTGENFETVFSNEKNCHVQGSRSNKLGDLLIEAQLINHDQLNLCLQRSQSIGLPLGRVLVLNNFITENCLNAALEVQVRIRDEMLPRSQAVEVLRVASGRYLSNSANSYIMEQAKQILEGNTKQTGRIGELLVSANILNEADIANAIEIQLQTGEMIGQILINQGFINQELLDAVLKIQKKVYQGSIELYAAVDCLKIAYQTGLNIEDALLNVCSEEIDRACLDFKFFELLNNANIINEEKLEEAFNYKTKTALVLAKILSMTGYLNESLLLTSLKVYYMVAKNIMAAKDATFVLNYFNGKLLDSNYEVNITLEDVLNELGWDKNTTLVSPTESENINVSEMTSDIPNPSWEEIGKTNFSQDQNWEEQNIAINKSLKQAFNSSSVSNDEQIDNLSLNNFASVLNEAIDVKPEPANATSIKASTETLKPNKVKAAVNNPGNDTSVKPTKVNNPNNNTSTKPVTANNPSNDNTSTKPFTANNPSNNNTSTKPVTANNPSNNNTSTKPITANNPSNNNTSTKPITANNPSNNNTNTKPVTANNPSNDTTNTKPVTANNPSNDTSTEPVASKNSNHKVNETISQANGTASRVPESAQPPRAQLPENQTAPEISVTVLEKMAQMANTFYDSENFGQAEAIYEQIIFHKQEIYSSNSPELLDDLNNMAACLCAQNNFLKAEPIMFKIISILASVTPVDLFQLAEALEILGGIYWEQEKYFECLPLLERSLRLKQQQFGDISSEVANCLRELAKVLRKIDRTEEAELKYAQARKILLKLNSN